MTDPSHLAGPHITGQMFLSRMGYIRQCYGPASVGSLDTIRKICNFVHHKMSNIPASARCPGT